MPGVSPSWRALITSLVLPVSVMVVWQGGMWAGAAPGRPNFGNLDVHFPVPAAGRAVDTTHPDHVIGNGRPASCTSADVVRAVAAGGIITFDCGPRQVTIVMTSTAGVIKTRPLVVLDGGGLITLSGGGKRLVPPPTPAPVGGRRTTASTSRIRQIVVQNITFKDGYNGTHQATCTANIPECWYGGVAGEDMKLV